MRLVSFETGVRAAVGAVDGNSVVDLCFPGDMVAFVAGGDAALAWAATRLQSPDGNARALFGSER